MHAMLTFDAFFNIKQALLKSRISMLSIMTKTSKGKVKSRNPNQASCKERKPHFATTQKFCLTNTCSWSPSAQEKRSQESAARASVNGRVKIKVDVTILKELAVDSPHLKDIISETLLLQDSTLISLAPLVLNYLKAKVDFLVKQFFSQTFKNWDLDLRFSEHYISMHRKVFRDVSIKNFISKASFFAYFCTFSDFRIRLPEGMKIPKSLYLHV